MYFLGSRLLAQSRWQCPNFRPDSVAFFCATCGEIWGRVVVDSSLWTVHQRACPKHARTGVQDWRGISGSFLADNPTSSDNSIAAWACTLENMPEEMLHYEFELSMREAEISDQLVRRAERALN